MVIGRDPEHPRLLADDDLRDRGGPPRADGATPSRHECLGGESVGDDSLVGRRRARRAARGLASMGISRDMLQHLDHADLGAVAAMGELAARALTRRRENLRGETPAAWRSRGRLRRMATIEGT